MNTEKEIVVQLSGQKRIIIRPSEWKIIARAYGNSYSGNDVVIERQARLNDQLDEYHLVVREHADGRALVYAIFNAGCVNGNTSHAGGRIITLGKERDYQITRWIRDVGNEIGIPSHIIRACLGTLNPEKL